jgi:hypothetical protein
MYEKLPQFNFPNDEFCILCMFKSRILGWTCMPYRRLDLQAISAKQMYRIVVVKSLRKWVDRRPRGSRGDSIGIIWKALREWYLSCVRLSAVAVVYVSNVKPSSSNA